MNCTECLGKMYPENPKQPFLLKGRYLPPICQSCHPEEPKETPEQYTTPTVARLFKRLEQLEANQVHQRNKWNEHMDKSTDPF